MTTRSLPALKLAKSPLMFVLAQVRFPRILTMDDKIPAFQEAARKLGYHKLNQREVTQTNHDAKNNIVNKETFFQWEFINRESTQSILVDPRFVNVNTSNYDAFESFEGKLKVALELMNLYIEPGLIERIGLRYVDLILPSEGKGLEEYVAEGLRGFKVSRNEERQAYHIETVINTGEGKRFLHRYTETQKGLGFPPDLLHTGLNLKRDPRIDGAFALLDMDHMLTKEMDVDIPQILATFDDLHEYHQKAFEKSVTPQALEEWRVG